MVIFSDLSEVLIHGVFGMEEVIADIYDKETADLFWKRHEVTNHKILDLFRGDIPEEEYWQELIGDSGLQISAKGLEVVLSTNIQRVIPGTLDVYKSIATHPAKIGDTRFQLLGRPDIYIVSDHIKGRLPELKLLHPDVFDMVAGEYWSCNLGCVKGDEGFFPKVLAESGIPAESIVFIDDIEKNVESAEKNGICGILFENAKQLRSELEEIGFTFIS